jgi:hypothetical protein
MLYAECGTVHVQVCALCGVRYQTCTGMCSMLNAVPHMYRYVLYAECGTAHVPVCGLCRVRYRTCTDM